MTTLSVLTFKVFLKVVQLFVFLFLIACLMLKESHASYINANSAINMSVSDVGGSDDQNVTQPRRHLQVPRLGCYED